MPLSGKGEVLEIMKGVDYTNFQVSFPNGTTASFSVDDSMIPIYPLEHQQGYQDTMNEVTPKASNSPLPVDKGKGTGTGAG